MERDVNILYYVFHHTAFVKIYQIAHLKLVNLNVRKVYLSKANERKKNEKKTKKMLKISNDSFQSSPKIYYSSYF